MPHRQSSPSTLVSAGDDACQFAQVRTAENHLGQSVVHLEGLLHQGVALLHDVLRDRRVT